MTARAPAPALSCLLLLAVLLATPAGAVIIDSGDGTGNTAPPPDAPELDHVLPWNAGDLSAVYAGNGWLITARHVGKLSDPDGAGLVTYEGIQYSTDESTWTVLENPDASIADLAVVRLQKPWPPLGILPIAQSAPSTFTQILMAGLGRNRGDYFCWDPDSDPATSNDICGWTWGGGHANRWGTNRIDGTTTVVISGTTTQCLVTDFTESGGFGYTADEAHVSIGDSGGGLFAPDGSGGWALAGILTARSSYTGQPYASALYGNQTLASNLAYYRDAIVPIVRPACSDEVDNGGSAAVDYPDDPGCASPEDLSEAFDCQDGIDNDDDGAFDYPDDPGCSSPTDETEKDAALPCDDGLDNDGDGYRDAPWDLGCLDAGWAQEDSQCSNGLDDDADDLVDFDGGASQNGGVAFADPDPNCKGPWDNTEKKRTGGCGVGAELLVVLPLLAGLRRCKPTEGRRAARRSRVEAGSRKAGTASASTRLH
jgi:hypothetical protein